MRNIHSIYISFPAEPLQELNDSRERGHVQVNLLEKRVRPDHEENPTDLVDGFCVEVANGTGRHLGDNVAVEYRADGFRDGPPFWKTAPSLEALAQDLRRTIYITTSAHTHTYTYIYIYIYRLPYS